MSVEYIIPYLLLGRDWGLSELSLCPRVQHIDRRWRGRRLPVDNVSILSHVLQGES